MATRQQIVDFLTNLLNVPGYRGQVEADPLGELTAAGFSVTPQDVPPGSVLPSDGDIQNNLNGLADQIESNFRHIPMR